ncbi:bifunctional metallophosphatase/5'-nucleotidase [Ornithinibacillus californiensis]|uniref:bifunctional metallophosphatase/5'-nucleotidase n=1 Tax=Ornithinibacillus californiensis TaxID=161536 RepID=UPI000A5BA34B|nr:bifunctional UDP-sugar hydrolase/5'-nucleotidase [Ornithinibacillus californiensis]
MQEKLYFYYTNDLHSNFEQWPRVATFMKEAKARREKANDSYWIVDIGDHVDRVHPISEALMGRGNVFLLNEVGYDLVTIGNNEGITFGHEDLFHLYDDAAFKVVCANLESLDNQLPDWLSQSVRIQSVQGVKVGVIGLTAPFNDYYELLGWHIADPYAVLEKLVLELKKTTDVIVLLSHLGINEDQEIARRFTDIDVIIGGHTHHLIQTAEEINQTIITAAGKHCHYVGEVILTWDHRENRLIKKEAYATNISEINEDIETTYQINSLLEKSEKALEDVIVTIAEPIDVNWYRHNQIMQLLTDTIREYTEADCAMFNTGLLLDGFSEGTITLGDIHRVCPHPINPCIVELSGAELIEVVRASLTKEFMEYPLKGFGFRGEVLGKMVFSGIEVETGILRNGQEYVDKVKFQGSPIDTEHTYSLVTPDAFTFGRLLPEVAKSEKKNLYTPTFYSRFFEGNTEGPLLVVARNRDK